MPAVGGDHPLDPVRQQVGQQPVLPQGRVRVARRVPRLGRQVVGVRGERRVEERERLRQAGGGR
ncbi:hypothetical protein LUX33_23660 [Actinomadura madurae]|uniref:hypothetical protein n=1 Tax=Actinomadura madurae TaxID=1993 RepID=UPI0020D211B5|nr:hypothetical protein [Actinomadura madurae]MCP9951114.1 hypothetical protein [Actinomadura madurae]